MLHLLTGREHLSPVGFPEGSVTRSLNGFRVKRRHVVLQKRYLHRKFGAVHFGRGGGGGEGDLLAAFPDRFGNKAAPGLVDEAELCGKWRQMPIAWRQNIQGMLDNKT